ncbi:EAP30/Vps36 family-domain-containing protein [Mycotypha africana]|uniref:EAP30/Vps36 family-domain-containing protein n=1 Tax=Mycotypha africana TaxID=64632 RepID=UPI002300D295|nr:EAP30/Vps36 family-domain-containing protein [Mycotypha africana]KAI8968534.1 EAP30/Vps36 family-domain-containing protein [Mycotypha africana]
MEYFNKTALSASKQPELLQDETILLRQGRIGLYEGKHKLEHFQDGICYLTTHRIIYVDKLDPMNYSAELSLSYVTHIESYSGFLRSSPKINLKIDVAAIKAEKQKTRSNSRSMNKQANNGSSNNTGIWACSICLFANKADNNVCEMCGVHKQETQTTTSCSIVAPDPSIDTNNNNENTCPVCTFINHPSMIQCEICGATLSRKAMTPSTSSDSSNSIPNSSRNNPLPTSSPNASNTGEIRLSFRHGGQSNFFNKLKVVLSKKQWQKKQAPLPVEMTAPATRGVGISAIEERIQKTTLEANETLSDAFQDLDKLMMKATEMVKLAESISNKLYKDAANQGDELGTLRSHLLNLGIASPVTKGSAGSVYHQELARELADFLGKLYKKNDDMKSLTDIYCLFNRARGVALISPEDLYKASQQFESLRLPFRLRRFPSGLLVIQSMDMTDDRVASRILKFVKDEHNGLTALRLAEIQGLALPVAVEQLAITEHLGFICRDEGPAGITFYENLFILQTNPANLMV